MKRYSSDVTDSQWEVIKHLLNYKRKRKHDIRQVANAVFYLVKTGCQWRQPAAPASQEREARPV